MLTVIGEALIDLVPHGDPGDYRARPGGSPFNVAIGLARLGHRTTLMARMGDNAFGRILRGHAATEGIDLSRAPQAAEPSTLAIVSMSADTQASYDFYHEGTGDWQWTAAETAAIPAETTVLHFGSIASWHPPGNSHIHAAVNTLHERGRTLICYDPNIRPALLGEPAEARHLIERNIGASHIVKASREDVEWLYPGTGIDHIGARWLGLGALLVIITDGPDGARLLAADAPAVSRPGREVRVVDTVGAGDAFTAGLLGALVRGGRHTPDLLARSTPAMLATAVDDAILVSALTCERIGADPPTARPHLSANAPLSPTDLYFNPPPLKPGRPAGRSTVRS